MRVIVVAGGTGGHIYPAIAIIRKIQEMEKDSEILYIGTNDEKTGACGSKINILEDVFFNHKIEIERGILQKECETILKDFFKFLRQRNKFEK